ncbi:carbamoyltransferase C-terminal domain-containing protein [Amycolatopsis sp. SID8362]|uniref:carbamoyltransferase family protein n=1 Tax=Amycolatopsis sp. SID8362 TaxID=2690346 RepID=UPI00136A2404|nr:carbamoyltransferase C-terminal domain-containing protein [Amycolatopsis sp. SID8362]NBH07715.1 carbamoyltransferase [Amycolatopsis sp. SID8362]NED44411.1 carbamoyltransferase [Amycolatopsis sp. SID8362]
MKVLGISGGYGHDAAAALVEDGRIVTVVEEERLTRRKHAYGSAPVHAAHYCLAKAGIRLDDVDVLALSWEPAERSDWPTRLHETMLSHPFFAGARVPDIEIVGHALSHASAAFYCSGFADAAVLTVDGQGDGIATCLGRASGDKIELEQEFDIADSLGFFYLALTNHLGFELGEEGKVMGLASYAEPQAVPLPFELSAEGYRAIAAPRHPEDPYRRYRGVVAYWRRWCAEQFGEPVPVRYPVSSLTSRARADVELGPAHQRAAATGQAILETTLLHLVRLAVERSGSRRLVIGGGVGLNCSANGVIERSGLVDELYVFPASGDAGTGLGAALAVSAADGERPWAAVETASFGPDYPDDALLALTHSLGLPAVEAEDVAADTAALLEQGHVIGWFQGAMELGPRALGNRSILADPGDVGRRIRVNSIKQREQWRPLAPSLLASAAGDVVGTAGRAPFMLTACPVLDTVRARIPAVVHVDGTCRPQLVRHETNPRFAELLERVGGRTGLPVVLNTSFNLAGEPLVCTPLDAIRTFSASPLDALVLGRTIIRKQA